MVNKNYERNQLQMGYKIDAFTTTLKALTLESFLKKEEARIDDREYSGKYQCNVSINAINKSQGQHITPQ